MAPPSRVVGPEGPQTASILLCGEAPGATEEREGRPFVGGAGKVLDALLAEAGIERKDCYITNVMQTRPPGNNFGVFYEKHKVEGKVRMVPTIELERGIERLHEEIRMVQPRVIVPLGGEALKAITGRSGIVNWRGSILETPLGKAVPTYHPAAIMRQWNWRPVALLDLKRAAQEAKFPDMRRRRRELKVMRSFGEVIAELDRLAAAKRVSFDIETETEQVSAIAFSDEAESAISIAFWHEDSGSLWSEEEELEIWARVRRILEDPTIEKIAQNAQFDMTFLADSLGIETRGLWMDTLVAQHTCYPELPVGLDFLCSIYTDQPYYKDQIDAPTLEGFCRYNALDACITFEVAEALEKELEELGLLEFYHSHAHQLIDPLMEMARKGVKIDEEMRRDEAARLRSSISELEKQLRDLVGHDLNPGSNKQMCDWLYAELRLAPILRRRPDGTSSPSADDEALAELAVKRDLPALKTVLEIREKQKILSTYMTPPLGADGRFHASYKIHGTETGRLSSGKYIDGTGGNIQNVPKGVCRRVFVPEPGNVFVECDLSQAEARVVAYLAGEERLIKSFAAGGDIHRRNASAMYGKPEEAISDAERQLAKRAVHGLNYGMGVLTFAKQCGITQIDARRVKNLYFSLFPAIEMWQRKVAFDLHKSRMLTTPFGRKRLFLGAYSEQLIKEALAFVPQSTVADVTNAALIRLHGSLPPGARLAITVHDSIVVECSVEMAQEVKAQVVEAMSIPLRFGARELLIPVDTKVLRNWNDKYEAAEPQKEVANG